MSAHTPGPWRTGGVGEAVFSGRDASSEVVAVMRAPGVRERLSDACLIAAAPDLLAALQEIAAFRPLTFAECSDAEAVIGIAEAAIAKATEAA